NAPMTRAERHPDLQRERGPQPGARAAGGDDSLTLGGNAVRRAHRGQRLELLDRGVARQPTLRATGVRDRAVQLQDAATRGAYGFARRDGAERAIRARNDLCPPVA